jgi:NADH-quinone oxidoreductase subunit H
MSDPVNSIADWLRTIFSGWGLSDGLITVILAFLGVVILATFVLVVDILLVWIERKMVARFQDRFGPNRVGPFGIIQPIADVIKLLIKEDILPIGADNLSSIWHQSSRWLRSYCYGPSFRLPPR